MPSAEVLDAPRVLALRIEPATFTPGAEHTLSALTFEVGPDLDWSFCADAWRPTDPPSCPSEAVELGRGNPLTATLPAVDSGWLLAAPATGEALPAVKRLTSDTAAQNPELVGITRTDDGPSPPPPASSLMLALTLADPALAPELVVSWYLTAGALDPKRTLASEPATLVLPARPEPVRVIAVVREPAGGTSWTETTFTVDGP